LKFVDVAKIRVVSGKGGRGCMSFRREAYVPRGGPDGGDGGDGGTVYIEADPSKATLLDCQYQQLYRADHGAHGKGKNMTGRSAEDLVVRVPVGTLVNEEETGRLIEDLNTPGKRLVAAKGGRGGRGNARFATPWDRAPRRFEEGGPSEERTLRLVLKLIADVGLVGMPNSGKSTLISRISRARPEIAAYPFTTKTPVLGVVQLSSGRTFVMADIPGLIRDAHKGAGMGLRFLGHVERTSVLLHLIDPSPELTPCPEERFDIVLEELRLYSPELLKKPMIALVTKIDVPENKEAAVRLRGFLEGRGSLVYEISALTGFGMDPLLDGIAGALKLGPARND
jgi:GTP-binding protein